MKMKPDDPHNPVKEYQPDQDRGAQYHDVIDFHLLTEWLR